MKTSEQIEKSRAYQREYYRKNKLKSSNYLKEKLSKRVKLRSESDIPRHIGSVLSTARTRAQAKGIGFNIDELYIYKLLFKQDSKCALTGYNLAYCTKHKATASIDRIKSDQGYVEGNVQIVTSDANYAKRAMAQEEFERMIFDIFHNLKLAEKFRE